MLLHRVEVDEIARRKLECFNSDNYFEFPLDEVKQFDSGVMVGCKFIVRQRMKVCQVAIQLALIHAEVEAFEVPRHRIGFGV